MGSFGIFKDQARRMGVLLVLLAATIAPAALPAIVAAAQVTERSIALSSASKGTTGVSYTINFTAAEAAGAFVVDFCSDTPIIGQPCTPPTGFSLTAATSSATLNVLDANTIVVTSAIAINDEVSVELANITNPDTAGTMYARIVTYDNATSANAYDSEAIGSDSVVMDQGGVAIAITDSIGVSGAVLESMTFCAAKIAITANCANASANLPVLKLGEPISGSSAVALDNTHVSTGTMYTQISTNAVNGAVINLKSGVTCGGLKRVEVLTCDIAPALATGILAGEAKFGVKTSAATGTSGVLDASGTLQPVNLSNYNNTTYALNYVANASSGITSPYGDPFLDTADAPVNNQNMMLTFGASISNNTPAGLYSTDLSLIATGKF